MIQAISDNIVFGALKFIKHGQLKLINYDGKKYQFGESGENLNVELKINKPGLTYTIINTIRFYIVINFHYFFF